MRIWRLTKEQYVGHAFDGEDAKNYPGRWNSSGVAMVYASGSLALAVLELLVHTSMNVLVKMKYVAIPIDIPTSARIRRIDPRTLPINWHNAYPLPDELKRIGDQWIERAEEVILAVPSAVAPQETKYLLNPTHKDMKRLSIGEPRPYRMNDLLGYNVKP